jgi:transposase
MSKRSSKKKSQKSQVKKITQFEIIQPNVAGIDISDNAGMMVAYPISETEIVVEEFECYTRDLQQLSMRMKEYNIRSIAMESTGVYWIPLFLLLQAAGFEVYLVNAKHVKNVTGRKDDEGDAEWIQKLHRCGLLSASFQPDNQTRTLRSVVRHRSAMIQTRSTYLNRMQKAMELMNLKLHTVISDIDGKTGLTIIEAILTGERDAEKLADMRDYRIKAPREEIVKSLEGFWTEEHLFELAQCYKAYKFHNEMIDECDCKIELLLQETIKSKNNGILPSMGKLKSKKSSKKNSPLDIKGYLNSLNEVDMTEITGISEISALTIYSEVGTDYKRWKDEDHFSSWVGLAPNIKISGGKIISSKVPKKKNHAGQAFRMAALSIAKSQCPLGDFYRRIRSRAGKGKAVVATARKLAVIYYKMLSTKKAYNPEALIESQKEYKERKIKSLEKYIETLKAS